MVSPPEPPVSPEQLAKPSTLESPTMPEHLVGPLPGFPGFPPISDDSDGDEEIIRELNEEAGIIYPQEVVATPKNESDDDEPVRRFELSHPGVHQKTKLQRSPEESARSILSPDDFENVLKPASPKDDFEHIDNIPMPNPGMERRMSVRFAEGFDESEEMRERLRSPSPDSLLYMKALENPMSVASDREDEFADLRDEPIDPREYHHPLGSPPAYTSGDEGAKTPPPVSGGSSQSLGRHLNEIKLDFTDRASRFEDDSSPSDDDDEEDDDGSWKTKESL